MGEDEPRSLTLSEETETLTLSEETLSISKRQVVTGRVRVRTETETFERVARAELAGETVEVTRVAVDRLVDVAPAIRTEGDVTIVPVVEEVLVVEKRLALKEEIHIRRRSTLEVAEQPVTLRRQHAVVERLAPETEGPETDGPERGAVTQEVSSVKEDEPNERL